MDPATYIYVVIFRSLKGSASRKVWETLVYAFVVRHVCDLIPNAAVIQMLTVKSYCAGRDGWTVLLDVIDIVPDYANENFPIPLFSPPRKLAPDNRVTGLKFCENFESLPACLENVTFLSA